MLALVALIRCQSAVGLLLMIVTVMNDLEHGLVLSQELPQISGVFRRWCFKNGLDFAQTVRSFQSCFPRTAVLVAFLLVTLWEFD